MRRRSSCSRRGQLVHYFRDGRGVLRKYLGDQPRAFRRQVNLHHAPVVLLPFTTHPPALFQVVHDQGDVPAAAKQLLRKRVLAHRTEVVQRFQHSELAQGDAGLFDLRRSFGRDANRWRESD